MLFKKHITSKVRMLGSYCFFLFTYCVVPAVYTRPHKRCGRENLVSAIFSLCSRVGIFVPGMR